MEIFEGLGKRAEGAEEEIQRKLNETFKEA